MLTAQPTCSASTLAPTRRRSSLVNASTRLGVVARRASADHFRTVPLSRISRPRPARPPTPRRRRSPTTPTRPPDTAARRRSGYWMCARRLILPSARLRSTARRSPPVRACTTARPCPTSRSSRTSHLRSRSIADSGLSCAYGPVRSGLVPGARLTSAQNQGTTCYYDSVNGTLYAGASSSACSGVRRFTLNVRLTSRADQGQAGFGHQPLRASDWCSPSPSDASAVAPGPRQPDCLNVRSRLVTAAL